uniref:IgGFc_binding domain-containing protein n=1 Tax=Rhabditophanes sp. KR3021 TaxID=114890 RepID=A0AC35TV56_9BILA
MFKVIALFFLSSALGVVLQNDMNSSGISFVTSFGGYKSPNSLNNKLMLVFIPSGDEEVYVSIRYFSLQIDEEVVTNITIPKGGTAQTANLNYDYVVADDAFEEAMDDLVAIPDPRIYITSTLPIKVIAKNVNENLQLEHNGIGDAYLVPQISMINGNEFVIRVPKANLNQVQLITIMTMEEKMANGYIQSFENGVANDKKYFTISNILGKKQAVYIGGDGKEDKAFYISADAKIFVTVTVTCADLTYYSGKVADVGGDACDMVSYMAIPIDNYNCQSALSETETRIVSSKFTYGVYVAPDMIACDSSLRIETFTNTNPIIGSYDQLQTSKGNYYSFVSSKITNFGIQSTNTFTYMTRFGGIMDQTDATTIKSAFLAYVPEYTQFITGYDKFFTFSDHSYLEVYGTNINSDDFRLDAMVIDDSLIQEVPLNVLNDKYSSYIIKIKIGGSHVFYSPAKYIAYAIGSVDGISTSNYGYLTGFSKTGLSRVTGNDVTPQGNNDPGSVTNNPHEATTIKVATCAPPVTDTPITSTTKGGFVVKASLSVAFISFVFSLIL